MSQRRRTRTVYRDSINGRFVTRTKALWAPATTVKEKVPVSDRTLNLNTQPKGEKR
jgi:hypothetical protein